MQDGAGRILGGLLLLVGLWIGVYWWWPSEPPISFATGDTRAPAPAEPGDAGPELSTPDGPVPVDPVVETPAPEPEDDPAAPKPPPPAKPIAVMPPEFIEHQVQRGETFATIARKYYGDSKLANVIAKANPFVDPNRLKEGRVLRVPKDPANIQGIPVPSAEPESPPSPDAPRTYEVMPGDSLSAISKKMYGTTRHAGLIFEANRDVLKSEDDIVTGQKLKIPPKPAD